MSGDLHEDEFTPPEEFLSRVKADALAAAVVAADPLMVRVVAEVVRQMDESPYMDGRPASRLLPLLARYVAGGAAVVTPGRCWRMLPGCDRRPMFQVSGGPVLGWGCDAHLGGLVVEVQARGGGAVLVASLDGPRPAGVALARRAGGVGRDG